MGTTNVARDLGGFDRECELVVSRGDQRYGVVSAGMEGESVPIYQ